MDKYAIFLDLDGTALSSHNHINDELITTVHQLQQDGHKIFIATGRQFYGAIPFHQVLHLDTPLIALNGGTIYDQQANLLHKEVLDTNFVHSLLANKDFPQKIQVSFFDKINHTISTDSHPELTHFFYEQMPKDMLPNIDIKAPILDNQRHFQDTVSVFSMLEAENLSWAADFFTDYQKQNPSDIAIRLVDNDISGRFSYCEYFPKNALKSKGIDWVIQKLALQEYKTMAFGDGNNDVDMLSFVHHGVAMQNGCDEVLQVADATTKSSNVDNGVAEYLQSFFL